MVRPADPDTLRPAATGCRRRRGGARLLRLALGFVGGWWVLQLVLLGTGLIALDRSQQQLAAERLVALGGVLQLALGQSRTGPSPTSFDAQASAALAADPRLAVVMWQDRTGEVTHRAGSAGADPTAGDGMLRLSAGGGTLVLALGADGDGGHPGLLALAALIPLVHLPLVLWCRRLPVPLPSLAWRAINGATGMATSLVLLVVLLVQGWDNGVVRGAAVDASLARLLTERLAQASLPDRHVHRLLADYQGLDGRIRRIDVVETGSIAQSPGWDRQVTRVAVDGRRSLVIVRDRWALEPIPALMRGLKNLAVLVLASALLCSALAGSGAGRRPTVPLAALAVSRRNRPPAGQAVLEMVRPLYFLVVFAENLCAPFLPRLLHDAVSAAALSPRLASALFMAYFLAFTLALLPASWLSGRFGAGNLIKGGAALLAVGLALPAMSLAAPALAAARLLCGAGQGVLLIGVQSLILAHSSPERRTAGTGIIVFGFNGGMVGGNAFGSLLVDRFGSQAVFAAAGLTAAAAAVLAAMLLAGIRLAEDRRPPRGHRLPTLDSVRCLLNPGFLAVTMLIGIPTKAVLTGVVLFALPLLLSHRGFSLEDVGQIAMFYAAGVLMATALVARLADRRRRTGMVLACGAVLSSVGMGAVFLTEMPAWTDGALTTTLLVGCILVLGMAHGCINAPVVTHVAELPIAHRLGPTRVAASYRLIERLGHMAGPVAVERCLSMAASDGQALAWIALAVGGLAMVFVMVNGKGRGVG